MYNGHIPDAEHTGKRMGTFDVPVALSYVDWKLLFEDSVDCISMDSSVVHDIIIGDWLSPLEFHVVFVDFYERLRRLNRKLDKFYSTAHHMVVAEMGMPCAVKLANSSFRRAVTTANASSECPVLLVDSGESAYVKTEDMRQLLVEFAELPPLAVQCQLEGAHRDMLYGSIIHQFHCKCKPKQRFKLSIVRLLEDRLVVHLFDSEMNDLFDLYFGPLLRKNEMAKKQRELAIANGLCKKEKKRSSDSDDEDDDEEFLFDDDDEEFITCTNDVTKNQGTSRSKKNIADRKSSSDSTSSALANLKLKEDEDSDYSFEDRAFGNPDRFETN